MKDLKTELQELRQQLENLSREKTKVEGRYEQLMDQLKAMGISSLEEGKARLEELAEQQRQAEEEARALVDKFKQDYKDFLL